MAQHEPQYIVVFSSFLILLGVIFFFFFFWTQNLTIHIFFFHHSYFVSSCCSELYRKLKKFQPLSPKSTLCLAAHPRSEIRFNRLPKDFPRLSSATHVRQLRLPSSQLLTSRDAKPAVVVVWASPPTLESPD